MTKKKNNPWYYYLNGNLVKKQKPAMPGDLVLIDRNLTSNCLFTIVSEVHIGGFHDHHGRYFKWDKVYKASKALEELTDLRVFKEKWRDKQSSLVEHYKSELEEARYLKDANDGAFHMVHDEMTNLLRNKRALIEDLEACIELLSQPLVDDSPGYKAYCDGQRDALTAMLSKVQSGYHLPVNSSTTK
jgi:hypothetical protein